MTGPNLTNNRPFAYAPTSLELQHLLANARWNVEPVGPTIGEMELISAHSLLMEGYMHCVASLDGSCAIKVDLGLFSTPPHSHVTSPYSGSLNVASLCVTAKRKDRRLAKECIFPSTRDAASGISSRCRGGARTPGVFSVERRFLRSPLS